MRFHTFERLHRLERRYLKGHTVRVVLATIASIAALIALAMILPFG